MNDQGTLFPSDQPAKPMSADERQQRAADIAADAPRVEHVIRDSEARTDQGWGRGNDVPTADVVDISADPTGNHPARQAARATSDHPSLRRDIDRDDVIDPNGGDGFINVTENADFSGLTPEERAAHAERARQVRAQLDTPTLRLVGGTAVKGS